MKRGIILSLAVLALSALVARADIPALLNYQGVLADAAGVAVSDGDYSITFSLYDVPSGGTHLWQETHSSVAVSKGIFNVILGSTVPLSLPFDKPYYLAISVEGGPDLEPRQALTSSAYSFGSLGIRGTANVFPADGDVGIGTLNPGRPLHIVTDGSIGMQLDGDDADSVSIDLNALRTGADPRYRYLRQGALRAMTHLSPTNGWLLHVGTKDRVVVTEDGNLGIGNFSPDQRLAVNGAIKISNTTTPTTGTIRFSGSDFEGYDGSSWKSFTSTGTGTVPGGTSGQTLRHSGTAWVATSNLYNDGTNVGIGTTSPLSKLHISGNAQEQLSVESSLIWGGAHLALKTAGGDYDFLQVSKYGPSASGNVSGIPLANLSIVNAGLESGPLMLRTASNSNMHFVTNGIERMRLTGAGPLEFYGVSYQRLLDFGEDGYGGGRLQLYDAEGNLTAALRESYDENAGCLEIRGPGGDPVLAIDGNIDGTGSAYLGMLGSSSYAEFSMDLSGDASVQLPANSIGEFEILDEPGVASYAMGTGYVDVTTDGVVLGSRSIYAPNYGYVLVVASAEIEVAHSAGNTSQAYFGVSNSSTVFPDNQDVALKYDYEVSSGIRCVPVACHRLFAVPSSGTYTFYFLGMKTAAGIFHCLDIQLTLLYVATGYGAVDAAVASAAPSAGPEAQRPPLTESDIARERSETEALAIARLERELAEVRAEISRIKEKR